jgi:PAS domain S-box-containing protein
LKDQKEIKVEMAERRAGIINYWSIILGVLALIGLYLMSIHNYLLFHWFAEIFSIVVACGIFIVTWNSRQFLENNYLIFIGAAYLFVGFFDFMHTLTFKGMGVFPGYDANLPTQLWIATRYLESISLLIAPIFLHRKLRVEVVLVIFSFISVVILGSTFYWKVFPDCFLEGVGLTRFKIASEYIICFILLGAAAMLFRYRDAFDNRIFRLLLWAIFITIETGLREPYDLLFRELKQEREALKESEEKFEKAFLHAPVMIDLSRIDDGTYLEVNDNFVELSGFRREEVVGKTPIELGWISREDRARLIEELHANGRVVGMELDFVAKDNRRVQCIYNGELLNIQNRPCLLSIAHDVTDLKRAESLLLQSEKHKAIAGLAGGVAHNFNNLLQVVLGNANLAQVSLQSGNVSKINSFLQDIVESSRLGAEVVKRLNRFAQGPADKQIAEAEVFDLSDVVVQSLEMTRMWWKTDPEKRGIRVDLNRNLGDNCLVKGNKDKIFEVLVNLIQNAAEAVRDGGMITVATSIEDKKVLLKVRDTGVGIPKEDLSRLFMPFFSTKLDIGKGLGLATSRQIIAAHGGEILADSVEGQGTTFSVWLPLARREPRSVDDREVSVAIKPLKILVIDNLEPAVNMLRAALGEYGHVVFTALSGENGLEILKENPVNLVICDLGMPGMNGWQVGKSIRDFCKDRGLSKIPFIMLTGWADQSSKEEKIAESRVDAFVSKPVHLERLLEVIHDVVKKRQ